MERKPYLREISLPDPMTLDADGYPFDTRAIRALRTLQFHPDVTFFVGENGSGKSTLLEDIALGLGSPTLSISAVTTGWRPSTRGSGSASSPVPSDGISDFSRGLALRQAARRATSLQRASERGRS